VPGSNDVVSTSGTSKGTFGGGDLAPNFVMLAPFLYVARVIRQVNDGEVDRPVLQHLQALP
jgi:hypothetical protein